MFVDAEQAAAWQAPQSYCHVIYHTGVQAQAPELHRQNQPNWFSGCPNSIARKTVPDRL